MFSLEAYLAQTDQELTNAIADFMDSSIVIPPTEIQDQGMLEPIITFQKKMLQERLRPADSRIAFGDRALGQYVCTPETMTTLCSRRDGLTGFTHGIFLEAGVPKVFHSGYFSSSRGP